MRHRRSSAWVLVTIGWAVAAPFLTAPAVAFALEPGVHVNPGSPAGIEYAFPLGSARSGLSGKPANSSASVTTSTAPVATSAPLFGIGITPQAPHPAPRDGRRRRRNRSEQASPAAVSQARKLEAIAPAGSLGDSVLPLVGGVLVAGALGGSLGLMLRRPSVDR